MITQKLKLLFVIINLNFLFLQGVGCVTKQKFSSDLPTRPQAIKKPQTFDTHGLQRIDNYYWLKERSNPQVLDYLKKEDRKNKVRISSS